jgi:hypothetical protein
MRTPLPRLAARPRYTAALLASAVLLVPGLAGAQRAPTRVQPVRVEATAPTREVRDNARADTLESWANTLYNTPRGYKTAARLYERAAALRGDDPRAVQSWRMASWLYSHAGDLGSARVAMERAAERAAGVGDVEQAANSYVDAVLIALTDHRGDRVTGLLRRTRALLGSPVLPADSRAAVLRRIGGQTRLAQAWERI